MQRTMVRILDDLTGEEGAETVKFALDRGEYEIDLVAANAERLRTLLEPYVSSARRVSGKAASPRRVVKHAGVTAGPGMAIQAPSAGPARVTGLTKDETAACRVWAKSQKKKVSDRGKLPRDIVAAWVEAGKP